MMQRPTNLIVSRMPPRQFILLFGLIAEEVAEVNPDLVGAQSRGQPESVRYEQINAMLLNEFLKEHRRGEGAGLQDRGTGNDDCRAKIRNSEPGRNVNEQASELRKVSAQLRISSSAVAQEIASNP
jgi:hypothetical protein